MMRRVSVPSLLLGLLVVTPTPEPAAPPPASAPASTIDAAAFAAEAAALRRRDCAGALGALGARAPRQPGEAGAAVVARLLLGFYAHACEDLTAARRALAEAGGGPLEDWRLYLLADAERAAGRPAAAAAALERLLAEHPDSRLRPRAILAAAELAAAAGQATRAAALIARGRQELTGELLARLDVLAWQEARARGDWAAQRQAARRLLVDAPFEAARHQVVEIFRAPSGALQWAEILSAEELERRAATLLDLGVVPGALQTLDGAPPHWRGLSWHLLRARALVVDRRGAEARTQLAGISAASPAEEAALAWGRAAAAAEAATVRRRGPVAPAAHREALRQEARRELWRVVEADDDGALALRALRLLFSELAAEERHDQAMAALRRLRQHDPHDGTGARFLWNRGWHEFTTGNLSGAIGYWSELQDLYPDSRHARTGLYWSARAFWRLGETERALDIYRRVAATGSDDFYRRQALARLRGEVPDADEPGGGHDAWPEDPLLDRAQLLTDLGLDDLALAELESWRHDADRRAVPALEALVLARKGARRDSLRLLREAFPELGTPQQSRAPRQALELYYPRDYEATVRSLAGPQGLPAELVLAMIHQESGFDPGAVSRSGARGLMQIMPATGRELARRLGLRYSTARLLEPEYSIRLGTTYFRQVLGMFDHNLELALAGYNGGPYRIKRLWREHGQTELDAFLEGLALDEPKTYVKRILVLSDGYRRLAPDLG